MFTNLAYDILIILAAGLFAGVVCRKLGISVLVGYLVVGAIISESAFGLVSDRNHEIEHIAELGVFLLLFSIGLEFSLEELLELGRNLFVGGSLQMTLVAAPLAALLLSQHVPWQTALLIALALSFSSTVLLFKALSEWGQSGTPHGRRAIGILLFQDAALIPLLLIIPLISNQEETASLMDFAIKIATALLFMVSIVGIRRILSRSLIPLLAGYRSPDLIVLFTLVILGGVTLAAFSIGLPPAIGAFTAGLIFSGNRWTHQIDALILPFRESFAAIFFVSLGLIANPSLIWEQPVVFFGCLAGIVLLKAVAATIALRVTGLSWNTSTRMGIGLAHVGEFAFVLILLGWNLGLISDAQYQSLVTIALASLILTPFLIRWGLKGGPALDEETKSKDSELYLSRTEGQAIVIGAGPIGRQIASRLEIAGQNVCIIDLSPVNLHAFSQQGFRSIAGDATQIEILEHARVAGASTIVVCIAEDQVAIRVVQAIRKLNTQALLLVRCRYHTNAAKLKKLGANRVVSEEGEASEALIGLLERHIAPD